MPDKGIRSGDLIEYHHVPHGYVFPKEHHHWWWYAGIVASLLICAFISGVYWQFDQAEAPLCTQQTDDVITSPGGNVDLKLIHVSCLGGEPRQRLVLQKAEGGKRTVISFDDKADIRGRWVSENEIVVTQKGGKMLSFEPLWNGIHVHYR